MAIVVAVSTRFLGSARLISALTLASRVLGLVRDMACSYAFGAAGVFAAFSIAFQIPNLFRRLFGEGALSAASIPVMTNVLSHRGKDAVGDLAGRLVSTLLALLIGLCLIGEAAVIGLYMIYWGQSETILVLKLTAITLPYMILICLVAILGGVQNVFGRFASPALMPVILNVFMIAAALLAPHWFAQGDAGGVVLLAVAVVFAGVVQLIWQWRATARCNVRLRLRLSMRDTDLKRIWVTMLPMVAGLGAVQINTLLDALIAWWFVAETIVPGEAAERVGPGVLYYAQRLYQFPLGVFAIALATAIFPALSRSAAENDLEGLGRTLSRGIRVATFEALPCLVGLILVREPMIALLFGRGEFAAWSEAADRVGLATAFYAIGIWAYALNHLAVRAFYSMHDAKTPLKVSVVMVVLNVVLNLILVNTPLKEAGLALATSICSVIQVKVLMVLLRRRVETLNWLELTPSLLRSAIAAAVMGLAVYAMDASMTDEVPAATRLVILVVVGAVSFIAAAWIVRCRELKELTRR